MKRKLPIKHTTKHTYHRKGFTLVEMLISVGVFSVIMVITVGALLVVVDSFQKTRLLRNTMENVSVTMESMVKRIRTGRDYDCNPLTVAFDTCSIPNGNSEISFIGPDGLFYTYQWDTISESILVCKHADASAGSPCRNLLGGPFVAATSPEIKVRNLTFYVSGVNDPLIQDKVTITISGFAELPGKTEFDTEFDIQTTVTKRVLDIF